MNRLILKYAVPLTVIILAVFVWVVYRRSLSGWSGLVPLVISAVIVWAVGAPTFIYLWPRLTVNGFKRAILKVGMGDGPIPVNTLYASPTVSSPSAPGAGVMATGTTKLLYVAGWLDLSKGPQLLHVPDMAGRYYSIQFTDPSSSANFAYVGKRATGTAAGDFLLSGPRWKGPVPNGVAQISSPNNEVLVVGRVFVENETDLPTAYALARQIRLTTTS
jgi:hypothetical protein